MRGRGFLDRPVASLCLLGALAALSFFILLKGDYFDPGEGDERGYVVILRHYGQDAREMERTAAIPLEDALALIPGIKGIFSSCEYGQVRVFAEFYKKAGYEAVREAAQRVYETLPQSAQRPEIYSSGNSRIPLWTAVAAGGEGLGTLLEKIVKPALEGLPGAGEVILSGTGVREIRVSLRNAEGALRGINAVDAAAALAENDGIFPGGVLREGGREIPLVLEGRYRDRESLDGAFIGGDGGGNLRLQDIGTLSTGDRQGDAVSRLNGKTGAVISVMAASGANPAALSRQIRRELEKTEGLPLEFYVLEDRGKEEAAAFRSVLIASLEASLLVVLGMFFILKRLKHPGSAILICAFSIPLISLFSAALLVCCRVPLDRKLLAGLSAGIGAAVDSVILCAELGDEASFRKLCPPLISGGATTIAALIPLHFLAAGHGLGPIILALGAVTLVSLIAALTVLRPLFLWDPCPFDFRFPRFGAAEVPPRKPRRAVLRAKLRRRSARFLAALAAAGLRHHRLFFAGALGFTLLGAGAVFLAGAGVDETESPDTLYLRVEFEGGFRAGEGDRLLLDWAEELRTHRGIGDIQTSARSGSGSVLVAFDPKKIGSGEVRTLVRSISIPGAFVYIPESSGEERIWELVISGEDDEKCRELVREAAGICRSLPFVRQTVLNFKDGGPRLTLRPDREKLYARSLSF
ncbi:MAG: efflux RND transporter permease subunit, partial [Treponema sp.]|nr:efflux RND transporter permease subunit [Treponema sp.]